MRPSVAGRQRLPLPGTAAQSFATSLDALCCIHLDAYLAPQVMRASRRQRRYSGLGLGLGLGLGDAEAEGGVYGLYAYPRRLCLWHAEPFEDVQRLPEYNPRRIGLLCVER
jgi:hypothetical protein